MEAVKLLPKDIIANMNIPGADNISNTVKLEDRTENLDRMQTTFTTAMNLLDAGFLPADNPLASLPRETIDEIRTNLSEFYKMHENILFQHFSTK